MPAPRRSRTDLARIAELVKKHGSVTKAAQKERIPYSTVRHAHDAAVPNGEQLDEVAGRALGDTGHRRSGYGRSRRRTQMHEAAPTESPDASLTPGGA